MSGVLAGLAALLGLLVVLLAVPVAAEFHLRRADAVQGCARVRWLFGLVRLQIDSADAAKAAREDPPARAAQRRPRGGAGPTRALRLLRDAALRRRALRLARDLVAALHLRGVSLRARIGLGDPAETGRLWALIGPLGVALQQLARIDVRIDPDFADPVFAFDAQGRCRLVPLHLLALLLAFVLSPATIRAWRAAETTGG